MLTLITLLSVCLSAPVELSAPVGERAAVMYLPQIHPEITEIWAREIEGDLTVLNSRDSRQIREVNAVHRGGGDWLVRIHLRSAQTHAIVEVDNNLLLIRVAPGAKEPSSLPTVAPSMESLLAGSTPVDEPEPLPVMNFLHGEALSFRLEPEDHPLAFASPDWLGEGSWAELDTARLRLLDARTCGSRCGAAEAEQLYELGWRYMGLEWYREGRHYLEQLSTQPGIDPVQVSLSRARSAIATRRWDEARKHLADAWSQGAAAPDVVEGLAVVSLATGDPARAPTGRLLAALTAEPYARLLAVELLQIDGQYSETIPLLKPLLNEELWLTPEELEARQLALLPPVEGEEEAAEEEEEAEEDAADAVPIVEIGPAPFRRASLRLGDALLLSGEVELARRAWQTAPAELGELRIVYSELYLRGPATWVQVVPGLQQLTRREGEMAAEALYLVAQIDASLGIDVDAITSLLRFIDEHPQLARRSDVYARLWALYASRARRLHTTGRWSQLAALHDHAWRPQLHDYVDDPYVLWKVADAYEAMGLPLQAVETLSLAFEVMVSEEEDDLEMVLHLAWLYEKIGAHREGLKTLRYLRREGIPDGREGEVALLTGRLLLANGEEQAAIASLRQALRDPRYRDEAAVMLGVIDAEAGRCGAAAAILSANLMNEANKAEWKDSYPYLALARCQGQLGRYADAIAAAQEVVARASSEQEARYAGYLITLYSDGQGELLEGMSESEDIWSALAREQHATRAFQESLDERKY